MTKETALETWKRNSGHTCCSDRYISSLNMNGKCPYSKNKTCSACKVLKISCDGTKFINCEQYLETCAESNTCEHCKHMYYNNDGSVSCDSPYSKACLATKRKRFKEES